MTRTGRTAGLAAATTAVALLVIQAAQGLVGSFSPRWEAQVLITVGVVCVTLLGQRLASAYSKASAQRERAALLEASVRAWPLPSAERADAQELGVFPLSRELQDHSYVRRAINPDLEAAISPSAPVLLVGPARAGKSRTALEAARAAWGRASVIAPRNAEALTSLLTLDPKLAFGRRPKRVLWLDGLSRYIRALEPGVLDDLAAAEVALVATARDTTWRRLLASEGEDGEAAKALAARARVFRLPLKLDDDELAFANERFGKRDYSKGLGSALASQGLEASRPVASASPTPQLTGADEPAAQVRQPIYRQVDPVLAALLAVFGLCLVGVGYYIATDSFKAPVPPSVEEQVEEAKTAGALGPRHIIDAKRGDFHGSGTQSYFFAFSDDTGATSPQRARSDEIQVWDVRAGKLTQVFSFEPRLLGEEQALYQFRDMGDIDGDGADELVGGYGTEAIRGELLVPFAIDWDSDTKSYRLISLAPGPSRFATHARGEDVEGLRDAYERPLRLTDRRPDQPRIELAGYPAQDFTVTPTHEVLISSYVADIRANRSSRLVEVQPHILHRTGGPPAMTRCDLVGEPRLTATLPLAQIRILEGALREFWREESEGRNCATTGS